MNETIITISGLSKTYDSDQVALQSVNLQIQSGEIFALLGPNGAGKTTLIGIVCGLINAATGTVTVAGFDHVRDYRKTRSIIGLVPQELTTEAFETVWNTVQYSRALFGLPSNPAYLEKILRELSLWDKKDASIRTLSGGMKRRLLIAKALSHEPRILFLDEPTAGVDVSLRRDMWKLMSQLRESGVTIILTTHYIDEAEEMADRVGIINKGQLMLVEEKKALLKKLGSKALTLQLKAPLSTIPDSLSNYNLHLSEDKEHLTFRYHTHAPSVIEALLADIHNIGIGYVDMETRESSLEEIFVELLEPTP